MRSEGCCRGRIRLTKSGKSIFANRLVNLVRRALNPPQEIEDYLFTKVINKLKMEGTLLYLLTINTEGLSRDVEVADSLGYSNHEVMQFMIMRRGSKVNSRISTLGFETLPR